MIWIKITKEYVCTLVLEYFMGVILSVLPYLLTKTNTYFLIKNLSSSTSHIKLYDYTGF